MCCQSNEAYVGLVLINFPAVCDEANWDYVNCVSFWWDVMKAAIKTWKLASAMPLLRFEIVFQIGILLLHHNSSKFPFHTHTPWV